MTELVILTEVGPNVSRFPSEKHFSSWLGLCPDQRISGGKVLSSRTRRVINRRVRCLADGGGNVWSAATALGRLLPAHEGSLGRGGSDHRHGPQTGSPDLPTTSSMEKPTFAKAWRITRENSRNESCMRCRKRPKRWDLTWYQNKQRRQLFLKRGGSGGNAAPLPDKIKPGFWQAIFCPNVEALVIDI